MEGISPVIGIQMVDEPISVNGNDSGIAVSVCWRRLFFYLLFSVQR